MQFLYKWVSKGHLSNLRKGMVEELEEFISNELAEQEVKRAAERMSAHPSKTSGEPQ